MQSCELGVVKYILFTFNLIFAISGVGLIVAGAFVLSDVGEFEHFMEGRILAPPVVLIVAGCIVFLVASLGCYGAIRESYYMLMAFALCLLIILIIELAVGIAAAVYKNDFQMSMKDIMKSSMQRFENSKSDRVAWNNLQTKLKCCGVEGPADWPENTRPVSCCHAIREGVNPPEAHHCRAAKPEDEILYVDGCFYQLQDKAESAAKILIGVGIGIAFVEVIGIILACWLASAVKNKD
ncbi:23 kDa integral membrane protein [Tribolium castaneum]|uniref:Tetraspanin n=1 Tax=Tribolium castaneum TaxID=7070 RepID=D6X0S1_TRICA|nr:PREDICTED: 23 kDa integral membrane protein [Tribolium castaneum]EFA09563.1 Tetraspanin-6-like Protein [Tribolium castaneum]|eukprot:XP_972192.1 PREDICTED: 23 kDa integral membrane protein [Tribolium castaneum]